LNRSQYHPLRQVVLTPVQERFLTFEACLLAEPRQGVGMVTAWSTQFEIGPVSQASIGNVGLHGKQTYVDLVVTPIGLFGLLVLEDFVDKHIIHRIERRNSETSILRLPAVCSSTPRGALRMYCDSKRHGTATTDCANSAGYWPPLHERLRFLAVGGGLSMPGAIMRARETKGGAR
jgi:hypothetical protein